ncbi:hypothetical protein GPECTOR_25g374 [Gonium pectorale]|uniref:Uncharacterized protein n=1 Tax=Gonium pectorale TaxID=33097 RepID=A0A150GHF3_GONPE|nr:hypothetical protein GPECTOR_25g374 [Gonium pectorale]|eukprot:KXZ48790.1 hypothetical protein GPECTOR_25g374 [Gonium pectorale]
MVTLPRSAHRSSPPSNWCTLLGRMAAGALDFVEEYKGRGSATPSPPSSCRTTSCGSPDTDADNIATRQMSIDTDAGNIATRQASIDTDAEFDMDMDLPTPLPIAGRYSPSHAKRD